MDELIAESLRNDPRVAEARRLLLEAWSTHRGELTGVRPATAERRTSYEQAVTELERIRGGALYYPYIGSGFGAGALVELADGSVKYDMIAGIGVHVLGHGHPKLVEAAIDAALSDLVMQGNLQQNRELHDLAALLLDTARQGGARLAHCFVTTSGAMANENALKIVFQRRHPADRLLCFEGCFMGRSLALSWVTDRPSYREGLPPTLAVDRVPYFDPGDPAGSTERALDRLSQHLERHPGKHAAMCFELVLGESGYWSGDHDFFVALMERVREQNIAVLVDEIQTFGRLSRPFAFQHFGLDALVDVVTVGKLTQACATLFTDALAPRRGLVSQTFTASTGALAAGRVIVEELLTGGYFGEEGRIERLRARLVGRLERLAERHRARVRGPFGCGAMVAATVLGGQPEATKRFARRLFDNGVITFVAGDRPVRVRMLPPVGALEDADVDAVCDIFERTVDETAGEA